MKKTCFVIIGFGIKTDYATGKSYDLDKTFENIIKPAFDALDILCYRTCDLEQGGIIDVEMYENILKADFVVADISTLNANAIYELGIRHALRPNTTIVIAESKLSKRIPFDVNHIVINFYKHLKKDIGVSEAKRFQEVLKNQVKAFIEKPRIDSPVYTFIPHLNPPSFTDEEIHEIQENIDKTHSTSDYVERAKKKKNKKQFESAGKLFKKALKHKPYDSYIIQQLALMTYKSKKPTEEKALKKALKILEKLEPKITTDPETLGLLGAVYKRLYDLKASPKHLNKALHFYERGYYVKQDYYNGINVAFLYAKKASEANEELEIYANYGQARKLWKIIGAKLDKIIKTRKFKDRDDKAWIYLTLAEVYYALGNTTEEEKYVRLVSEMKKTEFAMNSYIEQKEKLKAILNDINI